MLVPFFCGYREIFIKSNFICRVKYSLCRVKYSFFSSFLFGPSCPLFFVKSKLGWLKGDDEGALNKSYNVFKKQKLEIYLYLIAYHFNVKRKHKQQDKLKCT